MSLKEKQSPREQLHQGNGGSGMGENSVPGSGIRSMACFVPIHCLPVQSHLSSGNGHAVRATVTLAGTHSIRLIWLSICQAQIRFVCVSIFERHTGPSGLLACLFDNSALPKVASPKPGPTLSVHSRPLRLQCHRGFWPYTRKTEWPQAPDHAMAILRPGRLGFPSGISG